MPTADELRQLADQVEERDALEEEYSDAREAFMADVDDEDLKAAYHAAAAELRAAREGIRSSGVMMGPSEPGSVTVGVAPVGRQRPVSVEELEGE